MTHQSERVGWTDEELGVLADSEGLSHREVGQILGRSASAVMHKRRQIRQGWTPTYQRWTPEEDDFILATPHFTAEQVARDLGRGITAVNTRRHMLSKSRGAVFNNGTKDPNHVGARPLIAKSCTRCGLLLASEWFTFLPTVGPRGGWESKCRQCASSAAKTTKKRPSHITGTPASRARMQSLTIPRADRARQPWLMADHEVLRDPDLTLMEKALRLGRSYNAVTIMCSTNGYRSHVGLGDAERDQWIIDNPNADRMAG